jgi:hypothetical protein
MHCLVVRTLTNFTWSLQFASAWPHSPLRLCDSQINYQQSFPIFLGDWLSITISNIFSASDYLSICRYSSILKDKSLGSAYSLGTYTCCQKNLVGTIGNIKTSLFTCVVLQYFMQIGGITPLGFYSDALTGQKMQVHLLTAPGVLFIWVVTH